MNSGAEADETALKLARRWGYDKRELKKTKQKLWFAKGIFMEEQ